MNILLFGATGRVGLKVLQLALQDGHEVTAFVRSPDNLPANLLNKPNLHLFIGNVLETKDIVSVMNDTFHVVFSALSTDKTTTLSDGIPSIIEAMEKNNLKRFISIGTAGILQARSDSTIYRFQSSESRRKSTTAAEEHLKAYFALKNSNLDWTIFCPTYLPDGEASHQIIYELDMLPENTTKITVDDTAWFSYKHIYHEEFYKHRVGIGEKS
ncbi:NAD(P)-dependent oxidoreductase [Salipaludibacillus daqingensis]|uniref:NAD(P)-dependent oxidoreductase n=1 Tax=Salipaludibacillus daqingensis TaxID=3041001 RepID=UPI002475034A|nr:NAD(P)H-binding protein [Salipaludibacillus daqingensis]